MPQISIIVPVYKVEQYLDRCINSILNQTFTDFELILVDDGSPDRCPQMCDEWAKKDVRIRVIHKENGGLSSARNAGLDAIQGEYVNFVDSDDWMTTEALEYLHTLINRYHADFAMAGNIRVHGVTELPETSVSERNLTQYQFLQVFFKDGTQENVQYAWAKLYRAKLFESIRYPEGLTLEDVPTTFELALNSTRIAYSNKIVYFYFYNDESITGKQFSEKRFDLLKVWDLVCETANRYDCNEWTVNMAKLNRHRADLGLLCNFSMAGLSKESKKHYWPRIKSVSKDLRKNIRPLLKANMPFSRKLLAIAFFISTKLTDQVLSMMCKLLRERKLEK